MVDSVISTFGQFPDLPIAFWEKRTNMRLDNNSLGSIYKTQEKEITRTKNLVDFRFLESSFVATMDDVIGMTHRKMILDHDI